MIESKWLIRGEGAHRYRDYPAREFLASRLDAGDWRLLQRRTFGLWGGL